MIKVGVDAWACSPVGEATLAVLVHGGPKDLGGAAPEPVECRSRHGLPRLEDVDRWTDRAWPSEPTGRRPGARP
jgi:hypothetical protein